MSIWADCDICGTLGPCNLVDGLCLCDYCFDDYQADLEENNPENYCDENCADCDYWEECGNSY
jgi:hypothetical protein